MLNESDRPGVFSVYGKKDGERTFIGTWYSLSDATGMAHSCAQQLIPRFNACYVKEFGAGTVHFEERSHAMRGKDQERQDRLQALTQEAQE